MKFKIFFKKIFILFILFIYSGCKTNMYIKLNENENYTFIENDIEFLVSPTFIRLVSPYSPKSHLGVTFAINYYTDIPVEIILESYEIYFEGINNTIRKDNLNDYFSFKKSVIDNIRYTEKKYWGIKNIIISIDDLKKIVFPELTETEIYKKFDDVKNISLTVFVKYKIGEIQETKKMIWFYVPKKIKSSAFGDMIMSV